MTSPLQRRLLALPGVLAAAALLGWAVAYGVPLLQSDLESQAARQKVDTWARTNQGWTVEEWQQVRSQLLLALEITPTDPVPHVTLAQLYVTQGLVAWADDEQRLAYFGEALVHQRQALALRPTDGATWSQVAISLFALGSPVAEVQQAWAQALRYAPREAGVQRALVDLTLALWDQAPPEMRDWALQTWRDAAPPVRKRYEADAAKWGRAEVFQ
jgi:tetratricopeptide (TPR) repeat protein